MFRVVGAPAATLTAAVRHVRGVQIGPAAVIGSALRDVADEASALDAPRARTLLPQFDTGCWSRYSLGGAPALTHYHAYHISLLRKIAAMTGDRSWGVVADRWEGYQRHGGCPPA
jgi:hypothetical protein